MAAQRKAGGGAGGVVLNIRNVDKIRKDLLTLEPKVAKKVVRQAMRAGLKPMRAAAKESTQLFGAYSTGKTKDAIKIKAVRKRTKATRHLIRMQVMIGAGDYKGETFYAAFPEYGTKRQKAQRYMARAFDATKDQSQKIMITELRAGIDREWKKG